MSLPADTLDAVIVGSGAAGSAMAAMLARAGKAVAVLEAGPARRAADMVSSGIWARRLKWGGAPVIEEGAQPVGYVFNAGYGIGGSALHHYAVWPRFHPEDFECRHRYGRGLDWPIAYADLAPWYDAVQEEAGVSGDAAAEVWRPPGKPYPLPPVPTFAQGDVIARGFAARDMVTAPLPLAVLSRPYRGRSACIWDGWCDSGCPIGALANPLTVHLPQAIEAGAMLESDATATRVLTDRRGERATGVEVARSDGERRQVMADVVILAAFAVQNPRILLASATDGHPQGLANSSGLVGRYIMSHAAGLIYGLFDEETRCYLGAFGGQLVNQDGYAKETHAARDAFGSYQWMIAQAVRPNDLLGFGTTRADLFGDDLHAFMRRAARGFASMTAVVEDLPVAGNAVRLSDRKDRHGVPLAVVSHTADPASHALWQAVLEEGKAVFQAAGAKTVWTGPRGSMHIMGGTVMGDDPRRSVTDSYGRCHDLPNLVIAGPGLFPASAGVNPTFTVHALAARAADHLLANWSGLTP
ncbi:MAG TPA: GMC family oxidoreductase [Woeseiaceae bacterium]|nr:GMC family oxidoreductase [Woeseiaceae bacterium]